MSRILVIDDDGDTRSMLEQMLEAAGHEVYSAADGREGMRLQEARPADLVITDLFMPNQEGLETIIQLRKGFPGVPVIAMSGKTPASTMLTIAKRLGAVAILEKPFFPLQMLGEVERALRLSAGPLPDDSSRIQRPPPGPEPDRLRE